MKVHIVLIVEQKWKERNDMDKIDFEIIDDKLIKYTPVIEAGNNIYRSDTVIDKDTFIKCYEKWIKGEDEE